MRDLSISLETRKELDISWSKTYLLVELVVAVGDFVVGADERL